MKHWFSGNLYPLSIQIPTKRSGPQKERRGRFSTRRTPSPTRYKKLPPAEAEWPGPALSALRRQTHLSGRDNLHRLRSRRALAGRTESWAPYCVLRNRNPNREETAHPQTQWEFFAPTPVSRSDILSWLRQRSAPSR